MVTAPLGFSLLNQAALRVRARLMLHAPVAVVVLVMPFGVLKMARLLAVLAWRCKQGAGLLSGAYAGGRTSQKDVVAKPAKYSELQPSFLGKHHGWSKSISHHF